ncbi:MAG: hypothetical protein KatS3mg076_0422 [Candidatus Binatia bacterium]|nr:MAG: hypothetical protein KatS3mg076_0422 [Candidatus Binatia bacterium]
MATKVRIRRKDLRRPDEFVSTTLRIVRYAQRHRRVLLVSAVAGCVLLGGLAWTTHVRRVQRERENAVLARAVSLHEAKKYGEARSALEGFRSEFGDSRLRALAALYLGRVLLETGDAAGARSVLEEAASGLEEAYLRQGALVALGYAEEALGDHASAAQHFFEASELPGGEAAVALLGAGRNFELAGRKERALEAYREFLARYGNLPERKFVEERVAWLEGAVGAS